MTQIEQYQKLTTMDAGKLHLIGNLINLICSCSASRNRSWRRLAGEAISGHSFWPQHTRPLRAARLEEWFPHSQEKAVRYVLVHVTVRLQGRLPQPASPLVNDVRSDGPELIASL
jgi:hypothetical protein